MESKDLIELEKRDLIELPPKGKALIVTDLHGNLKDYAKLMDLWKIISNRKHHLIFTGDLINAIGQEADGSIEILESLIEELKINKKLHVLLGNHEWATIVQASIYKGGENQVRNFENLLKERFRDRWQEKLSEYIKFFKTFSIAVKTANGVFISHAGPPKNIKRQGKIVNITEEGYFQNQALYEILWNRYGDYTKKDVENFLNIMGCKVMIVGHTPVNGVKTIGKQIIISSSYSKGKKACILLDLEKEITKTQDITKMVKYLS